MRATSKVLSLGATAAFLLAAVFSTTAQAVSTPRGVSTATQTAQAASPPGHGDRTIPAPPPNYGTVRVDPMPGTAAAAQTANLSANQLAYGNGRVLHDFTRVALIFWGPGWSGDGRQAAVINMFSHIAPNPWTDTLLQYYDNTTSVDATAAMYAGAWTDTGSAPAANFSPTDVASEVIRAIALGAFGYDPNVLYLVYPNSGVWSSVQGACGWHTASQSPWGDLPFGEVDYGRCPISVPGAYGDSTTQNLTKTGLHELAEGVTDPDINAWGYNCGTCEIGDLCTSNLIAINFGGTSYAGQQLWGNHEGACLSSTSVTYSYSWVTQTYTPNPTEPGQRYNVQLVIHNSGNVQWPVRSVLKLDTDRPNDRCSSFWDSTNGWETCYRVGGMYNQQNSNWSTVQPGENAVFTFDFYVGSESPCATYNEYFNLVMLARQWFNDAGIFWPVTIGCYDGTFASEAMPSPGLATGDNPATNTTRIRFTNTGNLPWRNDGNFRLAYPSINCDFFYDAATWLSCNRASAHFLNVSNPSKTEVDPGETAEFDVVLNVPATALPGNYGTAWQLVEDGEQVLSSSYHVSTYTVVA